MALVASAYSFEGIVVLALLVICSSAYIRRVPRLRALILAEKQGIWGTFFKASVIGIRLHLGVSLACLAMAFYLIMT